MKQNQPKRHHYTPQFFLRNFAIDEEKKKITVLRKHGDRAVWAKTSIKSIAYETEFYIHEKNGIPISVESKINSNIETPLSSSETWRKISGGHIRDLDKSDRPVLYSLIRHLEVRTPHYKSVTKELSELASNPNSNMNFSDQEKEMYGEFKSNPKLLDELSNYRNSTLEWASNEFDKCAISIIRTKKPIYICSTPVCPISAPFTQKLRSVQLGLTPVSQLLPLTPNCYAILSLGDFDGYFNNQDIDQEAELGFKRKIVGQFAYWDTIQHMICSSSELIQDMEWANFDLIKNTPKRINFSKNFSPPQKPPA